MLQTFTPDLSQILQPVLHAGLFSKRITFQKPDGVITPAGQPSGNYVNVAGLVNLPCMDAPISEARIQATEVKALKDIVASQIRHVLLYGYFPTIADDTDWQAVIDGEVWDLLGSESDSQRIMTRVHLSVQTI